MIQVGLVPENDALAELVSSLEMVSMKAMPNTYRAFKMSSALMAYTWKSYAMGQPVPGGTRLKNPTGGYAKSIKEMMLSPFNRIVYSDAPIAKYLEDGTQQYDMKETHTHGPRSRVVKKTRIKNGRVVAREGDSYVIIPFRHGTPGSLSHSKLPQDLYKKIILAMRMGEISASSVKKGRRKKTPNASGELIPRANYRWGSRLVDMPVPELEGMVVMDQSTKNSSRSSYFTFRIISVNSPAHKWIQRARPGHHFTTRVVANTSETVRAMIADGLKKDLGVYSG